MVIRKTHHQSQKHTINHKNTPSITKPHHQSQKHTNNHKKNVYYVYQKFAYKIFRLQWVIQSTKKYLMMAPILAETCCKQISDIHNKRFVIDSGFSIIPLLEHFPA
jgi:hypothetical protein